MHFGGPGEIPGTTWLGPARWSTDGRDGKDVRFVVIHYTAGAEGRTAAENGAAYDRRRDDRVSTHFFVDADTIVQTVELADQAYAAFGKGNRLGVQIELCGTVQTRAQWFDPASAATLLNAARLTAELCKRYRLEPRRLALDELRAAWNNFPHGPRGIVGHVDCTYAYGQGDHTDPGKEFPWPEFLAMVADWIDPPTIPEGDEDDMQLRFAKIKGKYDGAVFLCRSDGTCKWVQDPEEYQSLAAIWRLTDPVEVSDVAALGDLEGATPPGWDQEVPA